MKQFSHKNSFAEVVRKLGWADPQIAHMTEDRQRQFLKVIHKLASLTSFPIFQSFYFVQERMHTNKLLHLISISEGLLVLKHFLGK